MSSERFEMRYPPDLLKKIDDWRAQQLVTPTRAAAIRYLIEAGLAASPKPRKRKP